MEKLARDLKRHFTKGKKPMVVKHTKGCLISLLIREMRIKAIKILFQISNILKLNNFKFGKGTGNRQSQTLLVKI